MRPQDDRLTLKNRQDKTRDIIFYVILASCVCLLLQLYGLPFESGTLKSWSNRIMLLIWVAGGGLVCLKKLIDYLPRYLLCIVLLVVMCLVSLMLTATKGLSVPIGQFPSLLGFLTLPVMILFCAYYPIPERARKTIHYTNIAASGLYIYLFHSDKAYQYKGYYGYTTIDDLTLGYPNANQTAMYLFVCIIILVASVVYFRSVYAKLLLLADTGYMTYLLYLTESRTAFALILVFFLMVLYLRRHKLPSKWVAIALAAPAIFAICGHFFKDLFMVVKFIGESLFNGREEIYAKYFGNLDIFNFLFGDYVRFHFDNMHNGYVSITATVGIVALGSYIVFFWENLRRNLGRLEATLPEKVAFTGFLCTLMYTSTEAAMIVGGSNYAFLLASVYMLFSKPFHGEGEE